MLKKCIFVFYLTTINLIVMNKILTSLLLLISVWMIPSSAHAQKMKVISGKFDFLKDQKELNVQFDYEGLQLYNENKSEAQYVSERIQEISTNKGQDEAEVWKKDWEYSKSTSFVDKFIASMNKNLNNIQCVKNNNAKYTIIVQTYWIYPGWFAGVMAQAAKVSTKLIFVETANPSNVLLTIDSEKAPGNISFVGVPNNNDRIAEGYAKTGKSLANMINKKVKK